MSENEPFNCPPRLGPAGDVVENPVWTRCQSAASIGTRRWRFCASDLIVQRVGAARRSALGVDGAFVGIVFLMLLSGLVRAQTPPAPQALGIATNGSLSTPASHTGPASGALDYFEADKAVDAWHVGLEGHSRCGKATLVAMAFDPRFAIACVSSSGEGGAKLFRRNWGETVENVAGSGEYRWMAGNFIKYAGLLNADDLPVDAHELIALCAPRPVFISGGATQGDGCVDAKGMFMAPATAGPVYRLLGQHDLGTTNFPPMGTPLIDGEIAFRQHTGGAYGRSELANFFAICRAPHSRGA